MGTHNDAWIAIFSVLAAVCGALGLAWSEWFLLAASLGAAAAAAYLATEPPTPTS